MWALWLMLIEAVVSAARIGRMGVDKARAASRGIRRACAIGVTMGARAVHGRRDPQPRA